MFPVLILLLVAGTHAVAISRRPSEFRVSRSARMNAEASTVFENVNCLAKWEGWSPWAKLDPNAKSNLEGPPSGVGAVMRWDGNQKVGAGSMHIVESKPSQLVKLRLEFLRPFKATNSAEFSFVSDGGETIVTWSMAGTNNFMAKAVGLFMDCERMVGRQFEQGLSQLKNVVEQNEGLLR